MKANEVPEKIYCGNNGHGNLSYSNLPFPNAVEYCRTNAFIEKACSWLKENADMYEAFEPESKSYYMDKDKLIDEFRNYMKGE